MSKNRIYHIRITLRGTKPPIWRRLAVRSEITLGELHDVIQIAMGWMDGHLHQFILSDKKSKPSAQEMARRFRAGSADADFLARVGGERRFVTKVTPWGDPTDMDGEDEDAITLGKVCPKVKSKLIYEYDFGDGWRHVIEVQKIVEPDAGVEYPVCLAGKKACPPEDCGGVWGYYTLLDTIADPKHEQHDEMVEWLGEEFAPDAFDRKDVNAIFAEWRKDN